MELSKEMKENIKMLINSKNFDDFKLAVILLDRNYDEKFVKSLFYSNSFVFPQEEEKKYFSFYDLHLEDVSFWKLDNFTLLFGSDYTQLYSDSTDNFLEFKP